MSIIVTSHAPSALAAGRLRARLQMTVRAVDFLLRLAEREDGRPDLLDRIERMLDLGDRLEDELAQASSMPVIVGRSLIAR